MILLEVNDVELGLYRDGRALYRQPAIAHIGTEGILFGEAALRVARLHPQQANQQYLARLNADPLPIAAKRAANHADLVYLHLLELKRNLSGAALATDATRPASKREATPRRRGLRLPWRGTRNKDGGMSRPDARGAGVSGRALSDGQKPDVGLVAAVPGSLTADQLGVLLGIAQEAGLVIDGFVDSAVLMASAVALPDRCWLLDLHLTRACLTELHGGDEVARAGVEELPGCGLISCLDGWANLLADRFVQETRFDPLHAAATEQQLFDQLYDQVKTAANSGTGEQDFSAEIHQGDHERRVKVSGEALRRKLAQRFAQVAQKLPEGAHLLLAPRSAALPGLLPGLAELGLRAESLAADTLSQAFARHGDRVVAGELSLVTRLPGGGVAQEATADTRRRATHVLHENRAWPLDANPFGIPARGRIGNIVEKGGRRLRLIAVEGGIANLSDGTT